MISEKADSKLMLLAGQVVSGPTMVMFTLQMLSLSGSDRMVFGAMESGGVVVIYVPATLVPGSFSFRSMSGGLSMPSNVMVAVASWLKATPSLGYDSDLSAIFRC